MTNHERVILIKGGNSKWYDQAIFIVNKDIPKSKMPMNFVDEAEKIINNYMNGRSIQNQSETASINTVYTKQQRRKNNNFDLILNIIMLGSCIILAGMLLNMIVK